MKSLCQIFRKTRNFILFRKSYLIFTNKQQKRPVFIYYSANIYQGPLVIEMFDPADDYDDDSKSLKYGLNF